MELDVRTLWCDCRTAGAAVDASRAHGDVEPAVEAGVATLGRPVAPVGVEHQGGRIVHEHHHAGCPAPQRAEFGHRDAASEFRQTAHEIAPRFRLRAVVISGTSRYLVTSRNHDAYLVPKRDVDVSEKYLHRIGRPIPHTRSPFAYLFERVC